MLRAAKLLSAFAIAFPVFGACSANSTSVAKQIVLEPEIKGPTAASGGEWRTKTQQIFDPTTHTLLRRIYTVWDPDPARNLDFTWTPANPAADRSGRLNGAGHVVWRVREKPSYDPTAIVAEYRGTFRDGRLEGYGSYVDQAGSSYEGQWKAGVANGHGKLKLPGGDEYAGSFRSGKADGVGRYIDVTGEIYEGPFKTGQRHGSGVTTLPNGRSYHSLWIAGRESDRSRLVRIAQGPGVRIPGSADDIRISIAVERHLPESDLHQKDLWYTATNDATVVHIRPASTRLMSMWLGQGSPQLTTEEEASEAGGVYSISKEQLLPLRLRLEIQNRTHDPLQIAGVYLDVKDSSTITKPAIQIRLHEPDEITCQGGTRYSSTFKIENYGWGTAEGTTLFFSSPASQTGTPAARFTLTKTLGNVDRIQQVDIEPDLKSASVDTNYLKNPDGLACRSKSPAQCLRELRAIGKLGRLGDYVQVNDRNIFLRLASVLEYSWHDAKGNKQDGRVPFTASVPLGFFRTEVECGEGGGPQTVTTKTQLFKLDTSGYRIPISFQSIIPSGQTNPLILPVEAEKSSEHEFAVVVQVADGREIRSRPVKLTYFRPRWFAERPSYTPNTSEDESELFVSVSHSDFVGPDLRQMSNAQESDCSTACQAQDICKAYTYDQWSNTCTLKSGVTATRFDARSTSGLRKGLKRPPELTTANAFEVHKGTALKDDAYLIDLQSSPPECEQRCAADKTCIGFTFKKKDGDCLLFNQIGDHTPDATADSAVKRQQLR